jgi:hypothetical protein
MLVKMTNVSPVYPVLCLEAVQNEKEMEFCGMIQLVKI